LVVQNCYITRILNQQKSHPKIISAGIIEGMLKMLYLLQSLIVEVMHAAAGWPDES
jgi:hypothetical protein